MTGWKLFGAIMTLTGSLATSNPATAQMRLDGADGPLILYNTETRVLRQEGVPLSEGFEASALKEFESEAAKTGYFGAMVVDRSADEIVFYFVGLHSVADALAFALAKCRALARDPLDCVEAARAVPSGIILAETGITTLSRLSVPLLLEFVGKTTTADGSVGVAISAMGHIAVSGPQPTAKAAGAAAVVNCKSFVDRSLAVASAEDKNILSALGLDACRVVFVQ